MNTKRIFAVIMTLVMVFSLATTVAAADVLKAEPWTAPENGINIIAGLDCVIKTDRGNMPHMTDGIVTDKIGDNFWTAGDGGHAVPVENPLTQTCSTCSKPDCGAWFQVNLEEVSEIDAIRIVTMLDDAAIYHWEAYATDNPEKPITEWVKIAEKTTDEISNADGYAVFFEAPIQVKSVRIYGTYCNLTGGENRFRVSEIELWDITVPQTPDEEVTPDEEETPEEEETPDEEETPEENETPNETPDNEQAPDKNESDKNETTDDTSKTEEPTKSGCAASLSVGAAATVILAGAWVTIAARKKQD